MIKYRSFHHLAMITNDLKKTTRFWRDLIGLSMFETGDPGLSKHHFFEISPNTFIAFFEWPQAVNREMKEHGTPTDQAMAFDHLAIGVDNDTVLEQIRKKLSDAGYWVSRIVDHGFIHSIYSYDPNNIPVEFCAAVKDRDVRETASGSSADSQTPGV